MPTQPRTGRSERESFEARTADFDGRTLTASARPTLPSQAALAARSLYAVDRLPTGSPEQREALRQHTRTFATPIRAAGSCRLR